MRKFLAVFGCLAIGFAPLAQAHQAQPSAAQPLGWLYPKSCCSGEDCQRIPQAAVTITATGYHLELTPALHKQLTVAKAFDVPFTSPQVRPSPDGDYHVCISPLFYDTRSVGGGNVICLFVPARMG
jgi:hypothetical protein